MPISCGPCTVPAVLPLARPSGRHGGPPSDPKATASGSPARPACRTVRLLHAGPRKRAPGAPLRPRGHVVAADGCPAPGRTSADRHPRRDARPPRRARVPGADHRGSCGARGGGSAHGVPPLRHEGRPGRGGAPRADRGRTSGAAPLDVRRHPGPSRHHRASPRQPRRDDDPGNAAGAGGARPRPRPHVPERVFRPRHAVVRDVPERGIEAGDVRPGIDVEATIDVLFGALLARAVVREPPATAWLRSVVDTVWTGIGAGGRG